MKLLNKSLRVYMLYAVVILLIGMPVFYFAIENIVAEDVDENLAAQKEQLVSKLEKQSKPVTDFFPEIISTDFEISPLPHYKQNDTFHTIYQYDSISKEDLPHRVLESNVIIRTNPYKLTLKNSLIDTEDLKERIVLLMGILLLCIIIGLYAINIYVSKKTWRPFYTTLEKLHQFRIDKNEPIQLASTNVNEFADLNKAITNLANTNQQVYQSQKEFTENASHEMQTPLAVLQSKIELLMQTAPLTPEQAELLTDAEQTGQKISKLNKMLVLLTKIENRQFPETEKIVVSEIIKNILAQYQNAIAEKEIKVNVSLLDECFVTANRLMMEILIANLLTNAIRHNNKEGVIKITVSNNKLSIGNTGVLQPLDSTKLFQRFQKQTTYTESLGLGLALVQRICNLYNAQINYAFAEGLHVFSIDFNNIANP